MEQEGGEEAAGEAAEQEGAEKAGRVEGADSAVEGTAAPGVDAVADEASA